MNLIETDIEFGFWYSKTRKPVYLNYDDPQIESEKNLGIGFYDEQRSSIEMKEWNKRLESLDNVEYLWTYHKLNQESFDIILRMKNLIGLNIKWSSIKTLQAINGLDKIRHLNLGLSTNIIDLNPLSSLRNLKTLESENLKEVKDWNSIRKLTNLEGLGINGGMYETLKLNSIDFIRNMVELKYLFLINTSVKSKSLKSLENLVNLKSLHLSNKWDEETFRNLKENLPKLKYGNVALHSSANYLNDIFKSNKNR